MQYRMMDAKYVCFYTLKADVFAASYSIMVVNHPLIDNLVLDTFLDFLSMLQLQGSH